MNAMTPAASELKHELEHMSSHWWWFTLLGGLLAACGTAAIVFPPVMVGTSIAVPVILGVLLMIGGVATIITAFWAGKWSGTILQLLVGILYLVCGFVFTDHPFESALFLTLFIAILFIVIGIFRTVAALTIQFPQWGWALLNGVVTFLAGVVIYRTLPEGALWVIGLLIGLELIFNGWMWIMLSLALRSMHNKLAS
ncbi:MAG: HdeD family acid-resistance protein [Planctomycetota bacterium]|nr:MAG: HdeD family acid-resistance protein [Planctomycetota bacterium]